ncbi:DUF2934 domain-containing protein [Pararobbsia alpina]|uniref:DUF2934 domain-containing protein n=1 Tax=Pararobbsia alpina TaxID=621374 RepID=A0A6S7BMJ2_9BURK|nr:DUF2934 domain-containing protein [Pararobbsia alpina]CAB3805955.1 hypothetical protein LMG28138_05737 [Pararobbsia alpina]
MDTDLEALIRARTYYLWQNDPSPDGNAEKHWEEARRQIEAESRDAGGDTQPSADQSADRERADRGAGDMQSQEAPVADVDGAAGEKR